MPETFIYKGVIRRDNAIVQLGPPVLTTQAGIGWSASYWISASTPDAAFAKLDAINTAEMACYDPGAHVHDMFVSDVGIRGDRVSGVISTRSGTFTSTATGFTPGMCDPSLVLATRFKATPSHHFTRFLRGLPEFFVSVDGKLTYLTDTSFVAAFNAWTKAVQVDAGLLVIGVDPSGNPTYTFIPIDGVPVFPAGRVLDMSIRRAGRPFDLPRGRRVVA